MRVALLTSGGKDGTLAGHVVESQGWEITHLVTVEPASDESWMFHVPNLHLVPLQAEAWGKPLVRVATSGEKETELAPLEAALGGLAIDGVVSGALASEYQKTRIDRIAHRLGIRSFAPLWHKRGDDVVRMLHSGGFDVRFSSVAAQGFDARWLGRAYDAAALSDVLLIHARWGVHVAGEGGEFETLVLDAPHWTRRIEVEAASAQWRRDRGLWQVHRARLVAKEPRAGA